VNLNHKSHSQWSQQRSVNKGLLTKILPVHNIHAQVVIPHESDQVKEVPERIQIPRVCPSCPPCRPSNKGYTQCDYYTDKRPTQYQSAGCPAQAAAVSILGYQHVGAAALSLLWHAAWLLQLLLLLSLHPPGPAGACATATAGTWRATRTRPPQMHLQEGKCERGVETGHHHQV
jgi:hypothetical protein